MRARAAVTARQGRRSGAGDSSRRLRSDAGQMTREKIAVDRCEPRFIVLWLANKREETAMITRVSLPVTLPTVLGPPPTMTRARTFMNGEPPPSSCDAVRPCMHRKGVIAYPGWMVCE